jgi:hypothetical protein
VEQRNDDELSVLFGDLPVEPRQSLSLEFLHTSPFSLDFPDTSALDS